MHAVACPCLGSAGGREGLEPLPSTRMVIVVFRSRLRPGHEAEFHALADEMLKLAKSMPGFLSYKFFVSEDEERCSIIEFDSHENLRAWREHPEHRAAQQKGRESYYVEYTLQVADPVRESRFER